MALRDTQADKIAALKAQQSKTGKSNVRRSKSHERTVAAWLAEWSGQEFRRRRVEGRDVTVIERESTADVIPVRGEIHCSIEAKCGEVCTFAALMDNPTGTKFTEWWHQTCYDVSLVTRVFGRPFYPMMFFRPYPNQNWIAISAKLFTQGILKPWNDPITRTSGEQAYWFHSPHWSAQGSDAAKVWFPHFHFDAYNYTGPVSHNVIRTKKKENFKYVPLQLDPIVFCRWKDFALNVDPTSFFLTPLLPPRQLQTSGEPGSDS